MGMIDNNDEGERKRVIEGKGWACLGKNKTTYRENEIGRNA